MVLEVYLDLFSQPCRALYMFLKVANVPFARKHIDLLTKHVSPNYLKKTPFHKVPLINDDGFILCESVAIMRYIAVKYDIPDHLYPRADPEKQARCDEFLHWHHTGLRRQCALTFQAIIRGQMAVGMVLTKNTTEPEKLAALKEEVTAAAQQFANYFLKGKPFICGDEVSAADLIAINEFIQLDTVDAQGLYTCNDEVAKWAGRVKKCMQPYFDEANENRLNLAEMYRHAAQE